MDIERALRAMDSISRDEVKYNVEMYKRTGDTDYAYKAIAILENFDDEPAVKELIYSLKR